MNQLNHLQPAQWESWQRKANDPEWYDHRYHRNDKQDQACVALTRELQESFKQNAKLRRDRDALLYSCRELLASHCCDTGEADYRVEWFNATETVCDICRPARQAIQQAESED